MGSNYSNQNLTGGENYRQLEKLKKIYAIIYGRLSLTLKNYCNFNQIDVEPLYKKIQEHIDNKIKIDDQGRLFINVFDRATIKPEHDFKTYNHWVKNIERFLEFKEYIRQELWAVAMDTWKENSRTYLIDVEGGTKREIEDKWKTIKGSKIKIQSLLNNEEIKQIFRKNNLFLLCKRLKIDYCILDFNIIQLYNSNYTFQFNQEFTELHFTFKTIQDKLHNIYNIINFLHNNLSQLKIITIASGLDIWDLITIGFVPVKNMKEEFEIFLQAKYPTQKQSIKIQPNLFLTYIDKNSNSEGNSFGDFHLLGKEFCKTLRAIDMVYKGSFKINDFDTIENQYLKSYFLNKNYSIQDLIN